MLSGEPLHPADSDYGVFVGALAAEGLPTDDLTEPGRIFVRVRLDDRPIGYGGYEVFGEDALLRSLVVLPGLRGRGLGRQVTEAVLREAAGAGARRAWLLTTTAAPFFERLGFVGIARADAPESIRSTRQAASLCPSSAALMTRSLAPKA
ncbi:GNAT family N-acetyltransferase [Rubellimicrobium roseum]|uniref:GNAT family N-acetyltransferase n=1 Tax=Rubellimicrobium roseum TaxID=687525 RepID=A0A5C4ND24_9RHOB|nr:GNAT family N-acetyltransferase [Rubellimicrobium roseum]